MKIIKPTLPDIDIDIDTFFNDISFDDYSDFKIILQGIFADFETRNVNNGRIYPEEIFREHLEKIIENLD